MRNIFTFLHLIRIRQWIKNLFVLTPLVFSGRLLEEAAACSAATAFISFCLVSSGMYVINDILDVQRDGRHPKKSLRPLASGRISKSIAMILALASLASGLGLSHFLGYNFFILILAYLILHSIYNLLGKSIVLVDVCFIALGFCMRIWAGAIAINVLPSGWLQMCVFLLALFLGFTKRRSEIVILKDRSEAHKAVLRHYSLYFLDQLVGISATLTIVFYGLYTISPDVLLRTRGQEMIYSTTFVVYGMFRYLYLIHIKKTTEDADELLLSDVPLALSILAWGIFVLFVFYKSF